MPDATPAEGQKVPDATPAEGQKVLDAIPLPKAKKCRMLFMINTNAFSKFQSDEISPFESSQNSQIRFESPWSYTKAAEAQG